MSRLSVVVALGLSACSSVKGDWEGNCTVSESGYTLILPMTFDVEPKGSDIEGDCTVTSSGYLLLGTLSGSFKGGELDLTCAISVSGYTINIEVEGDVKAGELEGTCGYTSSGYSVTGVANFEHD